MLGSLFGCLLDVSVLNLNAVCLNELLLDEVPCKLLDALLVVLLNKLLALVLVVVQHDALQQGIGICKSANLVNKILAYILDKLEVRVNGKLSLESLCNLLAEVFLVLDYVLAVNLVEEFLIYLSLNIARYLSDLIAEVAVRSATSSFFILSSEETSMSLSG